MTCQVDAQELTYIDNALLFREKCVDSIANETKIDWEVFPRIMINQTFASLSIRTEERERRLADASLDN